MSKCINYFDTKCVVQVHDQIISKSGGLAGYANLGITESTLEHIKNDEYYPSFEDKLTHLFYCIVKNHSFLDGNKRSAIALSAYFLEINGFKQGFISQFIRKMEDIAVNVANNKIDKELLGKVIYSLLNEPEYSEGLKLELIDALNAC